MKNLKSILTMLIVLALMSGLFIKSINSDKELTRQEFLFDTVCSITVYSKNDAALDQAFEAAAEIHRLADFFGEDSDTSKINNAKANNPVTVDTHTMNMLRLSQDIYQSSGGAFDISIAPISRLWSFDEDNAAVPNAAQLKSFLQSVDGSALLLDDTACTVTKKYDHTQIDLGAVAKGYAADMAAEVLKKMDVKTALIDFGGNIATIGENPKTKNKKWRIGLQTPFAPTGEYSKIIEISNGAVVTSGTYQRYFEHDGKLYHHIIDPKTGYPSSQSYDSVTVVAKDAATADCLATAIFVLGRQQGESLAQKYNAKAYFLQ